MKSKNQKSDQTANPAVHQYTSSETGAATPVSVAERAARLAAQLNSAQFESAPHELPPVDVMLRDIESIRRECNVLRNAARILGGQLPEEIEGLLLQDKLAHTKRQRDFLVRAVAVLVARQYPSSSQVRLV